MYTLGLNAVFHDSSACLVKDGVAVAAAEEERFTHVKHGKRPVPFSAWELPYHAIDFCLKKAGISLKDVDHFAYSFDPAILLDGRDPSSVALPLDPVHADPNGWESPWDPLFLNAIMNAPRLLIDGVPHHLELRWRGATFPTPERWHFVEHHLTHAASAFHASPHRDAAVMTLDGRGEKATTTYNVGHGNAMDRLAEVRMPNSLGMLYERVTEYLGFLHSSDEYKVMALASFGRPRFLNDFRDIIRLKSNGRYTIGDLRLEERFGPKRLRGGPMEARHYDIAHSLQVALEESVLALAGWLHDETRSPNLCLAGGVALNCVMNARLRDRGPFKEIWVQPAAGDAGTAMGAALWIDARERRTDERRYHMNHAFLGPSFEDAEIRKFLDWSRLDYERLENPAEDVAEMLANDQVIGWFQGPMEFGPRALGGRSILASPIHADMQSRLNEIKDREDFRPVAPMVLEEDAADWFENARVSPFMLFVFDVKKDKAALIPAVTHTDGTARVQTVNRAQNPAVYDLLRAFKARTGVPVLVNTSFNTRGEPVVCAPRDAVESFWTSPLDALVIGSFVLRKRTGARREPALAAAGGVR